MGDPATEVPAVEAEETKDNGEESGEVEKVNGEVADTNGNVKDSAGEAAEAADANGNTAEVNGLVQAKITKTVDSVVAKLKNDPNISDSEKIDTLCLLVQRIVEENRNLKNEISIVVDQCDKQKEAKEAIKTLNAAYKKQIDLVKEESQLRLQEEMAKREGGIGGYSTTMNDLSKLLETHTEQNTRLRDQNNEMASRMGSLVGETEKRDQVVAGMQKEAMLQIELLQHQVQKAQIEKAEIKADMTKERLEIAQELMLEREKGKNLDDTVRLLKEQAELYQTQMEELQTGAGTSQKSFQHFKTQIDKLTKAMGQLEKDTSQWRQKYETSNGQVKKMNTASMEREAELATLRKKLESMVKLNKTLSQERAQLLERCKTQEG